VGYSSFPSGHTASAFAMATIFALYLKRNYLSISLLLTAFLIGYSRIYLGHHFLVDVLVGAIIGIACGTVAILWFEPVMAKIYKKSKKYIINLYLEESFPNSSTSNG
jgi:undecaprenyl-diphosphatase